MSEVEQLEARIQGLSPAELAAFRAWFIEFDAQVWDRQIEADLKAGKLEELIEEAETDLASRRSREL